MGTAGQSRVGARRRRAISCAAILAVVVSAFVSVGTPPSAVAAGSTCGPTVNAIVCENQKPGTDPSIWDISGAGDPSIQGFATDISVNVGSRIDFKIDTNARAYSVDIYRTGWYQGLGARKIASVTPSATLPQKQPQCISDVSTELYDCGTWAVSASWNVPSDAVSGVYIAKLTRTDTGGASHIIFIVRNDGNRSDVVFQTSDPTWQAYNTYGGSDFYQGAANGRAYKISYNRPIATRGNVNGRDFYFSSEYATVRFLERNGYDVSYLAGMDSDRRGSELLNHKVYMSVGHDEYWSGAQRKNVEAARDAGVNLQFLSGNEVYWRTRYEPSADRSATPYRTLVSYKETWANAKIDPAPEWTGTWRDPRFAAAAQGGTLPENGLTGTIYMSNDTDLAITVSSVEGKLRLWRNTGLATLASGTSQALAAHTVGYESDEDVDNGFRPAGLIRLSTTVGPTPQYLTDYGNVVVPGTTEHHLTMYRAPSGALVFGAGTIQWGWGLDQEHDGDGAPADARMQQAQVNLFADMGVQPATLMGGLVPATKSADTTAPVTTITSPVAGASIAQGTTLTVTGTASDTGGKVAAVEVSLDGGTTWHPAQGTSIWTYSAIQQGHGATNIIARAIDDSGNYSTAGTAVSINVGGPYTVWGTAVPANPSASDTQAVELGLRFTPETDGFVSGVRFYKGTANTGAHTGTLWSDTGTALATVQFTGESASGWQVAQFAAAVAVSAGTSYVVSYTAPNGGYAYVDDFWPYKATPTSPLAVASGVGAASPGIYGSPGEFPTHTYGDSNYYVDVTFTTVDGSPLSLVDRAPLATSTSVALNSTISATLNRAIVASSAGLSVKAADGTAVSGTVSYDAAAKRIRFTPAAALSPATTYMATPSATDANGLSLASTAAWSFTTQTADAPDGVCPCSLFSESVRPTIDADQDTGLVTLGVRFTPTQDGDVTALKYFRGTRNGGTHVGALWSSTGTRLASASFDDSSAYGWQTAVLSSPVHVTAGQTYVVSYVAQQGGYSATPGQFSSAYAHGPLTVAAGGAVFTYQDAFPTTASSTSYLVDVVFAPRVQVPTLVATSPTSGATDAPATTAIAASFSAAMSSTFTGSVLADGSAVAGSWALSADQRSIAFTPSAPLKAGSSVVASLTGLSGAQGGSVADATWSFIVATSTGAPVVTLLGDRVPQVASEADAVSVELGMAFRVNTPGQVTGIRFYKGAANTGTHTGSLWGSDGQLLSTVTFAGESASGWQRASLPSPVTLTPGVLYTVSYLAPNGGYSYTSGDMATSIANGPLTSEAGSNGRYAYGAGGTVPTATWNSTNYFVDVEFVASDDTPVLSALSPARDATDVALDASVGVTFDRDVSGRGPEIRISTAQGVSVAGTGSYDPQTRRLTFIPSSTLAASTQYSAEVLVSSSVLDSWAFTTSATAPITGSNLFGVAAPTMAAADDSAAVEVGTAFRVTDPGQAIAIRFYKGTGNVGTHVGTLWASDGTALAKVTFANETASGWQRAALSAPVDLVPGTTYVVSYYAPSGHYASESGYFSAERANGQIVGLGTANGLFRYGVGGGFPTSSWNSSAYFVDAEVVFPAP